MTTDVAQFTDKPAI